MKKKIWIFAALAVFSAAGCKTDFLEDMKPYDKYGDNVFESEVLTGQYIDRLYSAFFTSYRSPQATIVGQYSTTRSDITEEFGGSVNNFINPNVTLQSATQADGYYGNPPKASVENNPYTRIRDINFILNRIDESGSGISEAFKETTKGQMYFMRALQYFDLVRVYGGVPIVTTVQVNSSQDESIRLPRASADECFEQIVSDLDQAAKLLPMKWENAGANYGRLTAAGALAMKSRVLLTAASPLYNKDWDNSGSEKWQAALQAGLDAETKLSAAGYGLYGSSAKDWSEMTFVNDNSFNPEALMVILLSNVDANSTAYNNGWENRVRPADYNGGGGVSAPKDMLNLFPLADGSRPTSGNYDEKFFFENRDPRFYYTFAFSGLKWGIKDKENKSTWFYRWKEDGTEESPSHYYGNNQTNSPAVIRKMSNPGADSTAFSFSGTDIFEYRYAELLLNIAECYAATGNTQGTLEYLGKIRERVGIPAANNYGIGSLGSKYAAIEACLYERRIELAYEGKRFWDIHRWMLYDNVEASGNSVQKLGLKPINGTNRDGYYWQAKNYGGVDDDPLTTEERNILIDPEADNFETEIAKLKTVVKNHFEIKPLDKPWDQVNNEPTTILFRPNYYISGLSSSVLSNNTWLEQTIGWQDYSGIPGTFDYHQ